ncbi:glycosyltransferase family 2 protein [Kordiimonas sp. SCSIO 12603]|uniref:glycosyltransferase family 2 protein n=1 Tax=Kordiimonas sp. SCSIO 12603 TaxID=2829596 RepID=UPI0021081D14|nr:glycosyltransferase family 2 protein [Kordiimonas sp. SCSIO 12603]UTW60371.1 glycosyltransferase family 2 protein [Kordiimonas sp. SCSIO 12603]
MAKAITIAAVIPAYKVTKHVLGVIERIDAKFTHIIVVDDKCPDGSGALVEQQCADPRVKVLYNEHNKGVGGAVMAGYQYVLDQDIDIAVKIDGDGQMAPELAGRFISPLMSGQADYAKGNRFQSLYSVRQMPFVRLFGNAVLSFMTKLSSGYWRLFDPTNGYTAIHRSALSKLDLSKLDERYFFETDMLVALGDVGAVVRDVGMEAVYADEVSNLQIRKVSIPFFFKHMKATVRRIFYNYYMRDFNLGSVNLLFGLLLFVFGIVFGAVKWRESIVTDSVATVGTVMIAVLPIILGFQLLMFFLSYDIASEPKDPIQDLDNDL